MDRYHLLGAILLPVPASALQAWFQVNGYSLWAAPILTWLLSAALFWGYLRSALKKEALRQWSEDAARVVRVIRCRRHQFMNYLQVISGWVQLGKTGEAREYIRRVSATLEEESSFIGCAEPTLVSGIYGLMSLAEENGIKLNIRVSDELKEAIRLSPDRTCRILKKLEEALYQCVYGDSAAGALTLSIDQSESGVSIRLETAGGDQGKAILAQAELV